MAHVQHRFDRLQHYPISARSIPQKSNTRLKLRIQPFPIRALFIPGLRIQNDPLRHAFFALKSRKKHDCIADMYVLPNKLDIRHFCPSSFRSIARQIFVVE